MKKQAIAESNRAAIWSVVLAAPTGAGIDRAAIWRALRNHGLNLTTSTITRHLRAMEADGIVWSWAQACDARVRVFASTIKGRTQGLA